MPRERIHEKLRTHERKLEGLWDRNRFTAGYYRVEIIKKVIEKHRERIPKKILQEARSVVEKLAREELTNEPLEHHDLHLSLFGPEYIRIKKREWENIVKRITRVKATDPKLWLLTDYSITETSFLPNPKNKRLRDKLLKAISEIDEEYRPIAYLAAVTKHNYPLFKKYSGSEKLRKTLSMLQKTMHELEGIPESWFVGEDSSIAMGYTAVSVKEEGVEYIEHYPTDVRGVELYSLPEVEEARKEHEKIMKEIEKHSKELSKIFFKHIKPKLKKYGKVTLHTVGLGEEKIKNHKQLTKAIEAEIKVNGKTLGKINVRTGKLVLEGTDVIGVEIPELEKLARKYRIYKDNPIAGRPLRLSQVYKSLSKMKKKPKLLGF